MWWDRSPDWLAYFTGLRSKQLLESSPLEKFFVGQHECVVARDTIFSMLLEFIVADQGCHADGQNKGFLDASDDG